MKEPILLAREYLANRQLMQLATVYRGQPWICTVHFVHDENLNLYWLSLPTRRHSREVEADSHVAAAIAVKADVPVIGLQLEGTAQVVKNPEAIKRVMRDYVEKFGSGKEFYDNFIAGSNQHVLYKFTPAHGQLFDAVHYKDGIRRK